jgi:hypothetical protein
MSRSSSGPCESKEISLRWNLLGLALVLSTTSMGISLPHSARDRDGRDHSTNGIFCQDLGRRPVGARKFQESLRLAAS